MEATPSELVTQICGCLDWQSLLDLSRVSKTIRAQTFPTLFRKITVDVSVRTTGAGLESWMKELDSAVVLQHVRSLKLHGNQEWSEFQDDEMLPVLVDIITRIRGLADFEWALRCQVPPCIVRSLPDGCRLAVSTFVLRSCLVAPGEKLIATPEEQELVTSPKLNSIAIYYDPRGEGYFNFNQEAIIDMVCGISPGLEKIALRFDVTLGSLGLQRIMRLPRPPWNHAFGQPSGTGHLKVMELDLPDWCRRPVLRGIRTSADLSLLRTLRLLGHRVPADDLRWMQQTFVFKSLRDLALCIDIGVDFEAREAAEAFITSLPPLESIRLEGCSDHDFLHNVLPRHGMALRSFFLTPRSFRSGVIELSRNTLRLIRDYCPNVEELEFPLLRTNGDGEEVAAYRMLGSFPLLKRIFLRLGCDEQKRVNIAAESSAITDFDRQRFEGHPHEEISPMLHNIDVQNTLYEHAMDESLVRRIYGLITESRATYMSSLDRLIVVPACDSVLTSTHLPRDVQMIFNWTARSWICNTLRRDDGSFAYFSISEYDNTRKTKREGSDRAGRFDERLNISSSLAQVLDRIWPGSAERGWKNVWHSKLAIATIF